MKRERRLEMDGKMLNVNEGRCVCVCVCVCCVCVCVCVCVCKQLPSNQSFDKQISSHQKGGGVSSGVNGSER